MSDHRVKWIAIGDHRGKELILSLETWKGLYEQLGHIQNLSLESREYLDRFYQRWTANHAI